VSAKPALPATTCNPRNGSHGLKNSESKALPADWGNTGKKKPLVFPRKENETTRLDFQRQAVIGLSVVDRHIAIGGLPYFFVEFYAGDGIII